MLQRPLALLARFPALAVVVLAACSGSVGTGSQCSGNACIDGAAPIVPDGSARADVAPRGDGSSHPGDARKTEAAADRDATPDAGGTVSAFAIKPLGCGSAGTQSAVAVSGSSVAFASLARTGMTQPCSVQMSNVQFWNVCYAAGQLGGSYTSHVVTSQPYVAPTGVGLAFDSTGNPTIAFTGTGSTAATEACGANDLFITSMRAGTFGAPDQVSSGSASTGLVASQAPNCVQNACNEGDATGFWPAIGFDPSGNAMMPFRDIHFGFAADDFAKSDVEFAEGSGGGYSILTIDVSRGGGSYNRVAFTPAGLPAVLQYDATGQAPGVYIDRQVTKGTLAAQEASGAWVAQQLSTGPIGEQLGFAISSAGLFAAAYYDQGAARLLYTESTDGAVWSTPASVDMNGYPDLYPSLAFDASGEPAIAYYRCNAQHGVTACDAATDGLYLARRTGATWTSAAVHEDPSVNDGIYPALAFVSGKAVIAFQEASYDPGTETNAVTWWVAEQQ